jgi:hypothetical protein
MGRETTHPCLCSGARIITRAEEALLPLGKEMVPTPRGLLALRRFSPR